MKWFKRKPKKLKTKVAHRLPVETETRRFGLSSTVHEGGSSDIRNTLNTFLRAILELEDEVGSCPEEGKQWLSQIKKLDKEIYETLRVRDPAWLLDYGGLPAPLGKDRASLHRALNAMFYDLSNICKRKDNPDTIKAILMEVRNRLGRIEKNLKIKESPPT